MRSRTTISLEDDLIQMVKKEAVETRQRFGDVLNDRLRRGFSATRQSAKKPFSVNPLNLGGFAPGVDETKLNQLYDTLEAASTSL